MALPNLLFFCVIGFFGDYFNFIAVQAEIFLANSILGATELQMGLLGSAGALGYTLPAFFAGVLSERAGRRLLVFLAICGMTACYLAAPQVRTIEQLLALSFLRSVSTAFLWPPLMAWMAKVEPGQSLSGFLGWYNVSWASGTLIGFYSAGRLFAGMGWQSPFYAAACLSVLLLVFVVICSPHGGHGSPDQIDDDPASHGLDNLEIQHFVKQGLVMLAIGTLSASLIMYIFPKLVGGAVDERGQSQLNAIRVLGQTVTFLVLGRMTSWHFRRWPALASAACLVAGVLMLTLLSGYWVYAAGFFITGIGFGIGFMMCAYYALGLTRTKGKGSGLMETLIGSGGLAGPLYGGAIAQVTSPRTGILSCLLPIVLFSGAALLKPNSAKSRLQP